MLIKYSKFRFELSAETNSPVHTESISDRCGPKDTNTPSEHSRRPFESSPAHGVLTLRDWIRCNNTTASRTPWRMISNRSLEVETVTPPSEPEGQFRRIRRVPRSIKRHIKAHPLQPGEIEYDLDSRHKWMTSWDWNLEVRAYTYPTRQSLSPWAMTLRIQFQDLPRQLNHGGIKWDEGQFTMHKDEIKWLYDESEGRGWNWVRQITFSSRKRESTAWKAELVCQHYDRESLAGWDFGNILAHEKIQCAHIGQTTAPGKAKVVMAYVHGVGYGNDLLRHNVKVWQDGLAEDFAYFLRPLLPDGLDQQEVKIKRSKEVPISLTYRGVRLELGFVLEEVLPWQDKYGSVSNEPTTEIKSAQSEEVTHKDEHDNIIVCEKKLNKLFVRVTGGPDHHERAESVMQGLACKRIPGKTSDNTSVEKTWWRRYF
ncbi:hypothetical protein FDECE_3581 [Fusarium decemcellulare]|nr:hypothetical protein FDECE_3581 [Fusarium decemcellulare]